MSGETTNYLGIILAVAGLFFVVVIASILMSCFKCCKKHLSKKPPPPSNLAQPRRAYGSTVRKPGALQKTTAKTAKKDDRLRIVAQKPSTVIKPGVAHKCRTAPETKQLHETRQKKTELTSGKHKLGPSRSSDYKELARPVPDYSLYNIDSQSVPDLEQELTLLRQYHHQQSFESFSSGEHNSSNEWHTPEEDKILLTYDRHRLDSR